MGITGAGRAAEAHLDAIDAVEDCTVAAVASPSGPEDTISAFKLSADSYTDHAEMCGRDDLDAVLICTPTHLHAEQIQIAIQNNLHILCEKPIVRDAERLRSLVWQLEKTESVFLPGHILRYQEPYLTLKQQLENKEIGELLSVHTRRLSSFPDWGSRDWFADSGKSGGVFLDLAIHDIDFINWAVGGIRSVVGSKAVEEDKQHGTVLLETHDGVTCTVEASWAQPENRPFVTQFEAVGSQGVMNYSDSTIGFEGPSKDVDSRESSGKSQERIDFWTDTDSSELWRCTGDAWENQMVEFVDCIREGESPRTSLEDAIQAVKIAGAANESVKKNQRIFIE
ncbi:Gfo/Idh/MocA family protein [Haloarchaeobius amylolyticus]|uniref:Gfo/Idh/MocA family protein n=1 Tax=Haloarchaeobius amylolyticus TaxID=1198296 RepID=UPI002270F26B|nr:Gfo/Idh/MocA family oxidoreductase [Haloarchaeobius amylolyticus]